MKNETTTRANAGRTPNDYEQLRFEASVLYIKNGLSAKEISKQLRVSMPALQRWCKAGRWQELRPDLELLKEYKAASMYVQKGFTPAEIAMRLSLSEMAVKMWIDVNGWNAAKLITEAQNSTVAIVADFCNYFKKMFASDSAKVEVIQNSYIKLISPLK